MAVGRVLRKKRVIGVIRVDNEKARQHGYLARFECAGRKFSKWFGDWTHGGDRAALLAAEAWAVSERRKCGAPVRWETG